MPIYIKNNIKIYHAHIPKCAGTSIENFFINKNFEYAFLDKKFFAKNQEILWSKSSPQHLLAHNFIDLFSSLNFDFKFSVVRNPIDRFVSAFTFNVFRKTIPSENINRFIDLFYEKKKFKIFSLDNHFIPMIYFVENITNINIYKLEDGINQLELDLTKIINHKKQIKFSNDNKQRVIDKSLISLNKSSIKKLEEIYKVDFEKFNY